VLLDSLIEARWVTVENDGVTALYGAHAGRPGAIVISGTGTLGLGLRQDGHRVRVGGWGWLVGDEGSAVAIGRSGLRAALAAFDAVGPPTALESSVRRHFGVDRMHDVKRRVYATAFGARGFAALATIVAAAAAGGDAVAGEIISQAGRDLARTAAALLSRLDFGDEPVPLALVGGGFEHLEGLRAAFETALAASRVRTRLVSPDLPPVLGAVLLALRACEASLTAALPGLRASTGTLRFA
jgi:N-acetylglucosamine kinase-like BadF-type ATPase